MALAEFAPDGRLVFANARFLALLDLGPEHQGNLEHARLCPPELVRSPDYAAMWRSLCTGHEFSGVVERVRGDGGRCWLEALYAPVRDHEGKVSRILVVATDVGHSKRTELARQDHLWRLSLVADYTDAAIVITDARSRVVYSNDGFQRMFGWTLGEIQGQKMLELLVPQIATGRAEEVRAGLRQGLPGDFEAVVTGKEGRRYWSKIICNPVMDAQGQWTCTVSVLLDITKTKIHEVLHHRALQAMSQDLPLIQVLEVVCEEVERVAPEVCASILQVDEQGLLHPLAGPSLPFSYSSQLDGVRIGPDVGSCGTAAWLRRPVLVTDIEADPLWAEFKHLILPLGFNVCWSTPIQQKNGKVLGNLRLLLPRGRPLRGIQLPPATGGGLRRPVRTGYGTRADTPADPAAGVLRRAHRPAEPQPSGNPGRATAGHGAESRPARRDPVRGPGPFQAHQRFAGPGHGRRPAARSGHAHAGTGAPGRRGRPPAGRRIHPRPAPAGQRGGQCPDRTLAGAADAAVATARHQGRPEHQHGRGHVSAGRHGHRQPAAPRRDGPAPGQVRRHRADRFLRRGTEPDRGGTSGAGEGTARHPAGQGPGAALPAADRTGQRTPAWPGSPRAGGIRSWA